MKFIAPVPDEALPALRLHLARGAPLAAMVVASSICVVGAALVLAGRVVVWRELAIVAGSLSLVLVALRGLSSKTGEKPEQVLFASSAVMLLAMCAEGWAARDGISDDLEYAFAIPIALAAFAPWPPRYTLLLGALALMVGYLAAAAGIAGLPIPFWKQAELLAIGTSVGALSNQMQRHLWEAFEGGRRQMAALDRVAGLGRLTAGLAHEIKTPVAATMNSLESARILLEELRQSIGDQQVTPDDLREIISEMQGVMTNAAHATERVGQIIRRVREHTLGMNSTSTARFLVLDRARAIEALVVHVLSHSGAKLDLSGISPDAAVQGDIGKFDQILLNLVLNAIEAGSAADPGATVTIATSLSARGALSVSVQDDGPGVSPEAQEQLFQPMYTTKANGTGLGLAISRELAEGAFGGTLELVAGAAGARFELKFGKPAATQSLGPAMPASRP